MLKLSWCYAYFTAHDLGNSMCDKIISTGDVWKQWKHWDVVKSLENASMWTMSHILRLQPLSYVTDFLNYQRTQVVTMALNASLSVIIRLCVVWLLCCGTVSGLWCFVLAHLFLFSADTLYVVFLTHAVSQVVEQNYILHPSQVSQLPS